MWHKKQHGEGLVPYSGIDTEARWGRSRTKGWVFGYKLHLVSSTGSLIVPLSADFTTANVPDNKVYREGDGIIERREVRGWGSRGTTSTTSTS